jgi:hypothetical protein
LDDVEHDALEILDAAEVVVGGGQRVRLQLCEWHAIQAIKRRLVAAGRYTKEKREEVIDLVNAWVKASMDSLDEKRRELLEALYVEEKEYISTNY